MRVPATLPLMGSTSATQAGTAATLLLMDGTALVSLDSKPARQGRRSWWIARQFVLVHDVVTSAGTPAMWVGKQVTLVGTQVTWAHKQVTWVDKQVTWAHTVAVMLPRMMMM